MSALARRQEKAPCGGDDGAIPERRNGAGNDGMAATCVLLFCNIALAQSIFGWRQSDCRRAIAAGAPARIEYAVNGLYHQWSVHVYRSFSDDGRGVRRLGRFL